MVRWFWRFLREKFLEKRKKKVALPQIRVFGAPLRIWVDGSMGFGPNLGDWVQSGGLGPIWVNYDQNSGFDQPWWILAGIQSPCRNRQANRTSFGVPRGFCSLVLRIIGLLPNTRCFRPLACLFSQLFLLEMGFPYKLSPTFRVFHRTP